MAELSRVTFIVSLFILLLSKKKKLIKILYTYIYLENYWTTIGKIALAGYQIYDLWHSSAPHNLKAAYIAAAGFFHDNKTRIHASRHPPIGSSFLSLFYSFPEGYPR